MTHTIAINIVDFPETWGGPHYLWMTEDLMRAEQFEPLLWVQENVRGPWAWQLVDTSNHNRVFNKYSERLGLFDSILGVEMHIMFDSVDDALLFKLTCC